MVGEGTEIYKKKSVDVADGFIIMLVFDEDNKYLLQVLHQVDFLEV